MSVREHWINVRVNPEELARIREKQKELGIDDRAYQLAYFAVMMKARQYNRRNSLQVCLDSGAKKVLLPITSAADLGTVPPELVGSFNLIFYSSAEDAVFKALGVE